MTTRMLIDARHQEETRVAVLKGNRIEEFDFESADHKQIKGNIYLAKVTRVEPSLQAAFVDFGGNRHGFLAFSEIHPDYYQIPKEDREALLAEEARHAEEEAALRAAEEDEDEDFDESEFAESEFSGSDAYDDGEGVTEVDDAGTGRVATIEGGVIDGEGGDDAEGAENDGDGDEGGEGDGRQGRGRGRRRQSRGQAKEADDLRARRLALRRRYKIQDVIQRRQVLLVQVVKEERGNKGAALTTYLSLAGRYCVLMPNSSHGGGISRKINSSADRKRLKSIISELALPKSMSCIVRTAGLQRTKTEIKRDFDYLARLWDEIRENTMKATAPELIHSDSDLVKRAIRDIYNRDIEEVVVEGEYGYRAARDFMKLLMPSHARRVKQYADPVPLYQRYGAEDQLTAMYDPVVQLRSGGYLVINPTEALVSIDINSGRSTKELGIEATAVSTNLEAAREIARQLRLRDMAGLVVIDFIDMEYGSNVRKVEKAMKDALKDDRARIQVGRISGFGLMEMSRQRLRTGVLEATTRACPHCDGSGLVRTASSAGLSALRMIEDEAAKGKGSVITLYASQEAAIYVLNAKRGDLAEIEMRYGVLVEVIPEGENEGAKMRVASRGPRPEFIPRFEPIAEPVEDDLIDEEDDIEDEDDVEREAPRDSQREPREPREPRDSAEAGDGASRRKRRRRRRGRNRDRLDDDGTVQTGTPENDASESEVGESETGDGDDAGDEDGAGEVHADSGEAGGEGRRKRRRRNRRRRNRDDVQAGDAQTGEAEAGADEAEGTIEQTEAATEAAPVATTAVPTDSVDEAPAKPRRGRRRKADVEIVAPEVEMVAAPAAAAAPEQDVEPAAEVVTKPKRGRRKTAAATETVEAPAPVETMVAAEPEAPAQPKRARRKKAEAEPAPETIGETVEAAPDAEPAIGSAVPVSATGEGAEPNAADEGTGEGQDSPRRGWWQRTFGA